MSRHPLSGWFTDEELRILSRRHTHPGLNDWACEGPDEPLNWRRVTWTMVGIVLSLMGLLALGGLVSAVFGWQA